MVILAVRVTINDMAMDTVLQELDRRLERAGQFVENNAKDNMQGHNRTSTLQGSIQHTDPVNHKVVVGTNVEYAAAFHQGHGTWQGHPFLRDALFNHVTEIQNMLGGK